MKHLTKWAILLIVSCAMFLFAACDLIPTPAPVCVPIYDVTKTEDTDDGVCSPGDCSLREAVSNANACPGLQTINLPAGGYTLTIDGDDENLNKTGDLDVLDDLVIVGAGAPSINGNIERSFYIHSGVTATFEGIWLTDGDAIYGGGLVNEGFLTLNNFTCNYNNVSIPPGGMGDAMGGCIFNTGVTHIHNGHFLANTAGYGGAIYNLAWGAVEVVDSSLTANEAEYHGGAVWNDANADIHLYTSTLDMNEAGYRGGAVWSHGTVNLEGTILEDNQAADFGGGIYLWEGFGTLDNSWLTLNSAGEGAGIYNEDGLMHINESSLTANAATGGMGGGIYNNGLTPSNGILMYNTTISANTAASGGAGIYNTGQFDLRFITVADNNPEGIRIDGGAEIKLRSSILSNNAGGDCAGIIPDSLNYNLTSDATCPLGGSHDIVNVTPLIEPLGFHGSVGPSHPLTYGSPALDSGTPDLCISQDQNFTSRPQGPWCDRGAFENLYDKGILRGWTYIDANRNNIRDLTDGAISGAMLELKEGPCPGGAIAATAVSNPDGFYRIYDIEPGDYCIDTSPLQQTMYPEYIGLSFGPGDVLEEVNFRYLLSPLGDSSISGKVWHDECAVPYGTPTSTPPGCIAFRGGGYGADGIFDPSEPGIEGVKVELYNGGCPVMALGPSAIVYTDANGDFTIPGLTEHDWCLVVNALNPPNDSILIPGNWTYPVRNATPAETEVPLGPSEDVVDVNFGWDYQFLPEPLIPYSYLCPALENLNIRRGPGVDFLRTGGMKEGEKFEVMAKSEKEDPMWYFGRSEDGAFGWVIEELLKCKEIDPSLLDTRLTPLYLPTPTPTPPPVTCSPKMDQENCEKYGGSWTRNGYCICP